MPGYSGTPLAKKLGIKGDMTILAIDAPKDYAALLGTLPSGASIVAKTNPGGAEMVHLFVPSLAALEKQLPRARKAMTADGAIWGLLVQEGRENSDRRHRRRHPCPRTENRSRRCEGLRRHRYLVRPQARGAEAPALTAIKPPLSKP